MYAKTYTITYKFVDPSKAEVRDRSGTYAMTYSNAISATDALFKWTLKYLGREYIQTSYDVYTPTSIIIHDNDELAHDYPSFGTVYPITYDWGQVGKTDERIRAYVIDYGG